MDWIVSVIILIIYLAISGITALVRKLGLKKVYTKAANLIGLKYFSGGFRHPPSLAGKVGIYSTKVSHPYWLTSINEYQIEVPQSKDKRFYFNFSLRQKKGMDSVDSSYLKTITIGDPLFDKMFVIEGSDKMKAFALFNEESRQMIRKVAGRAYGKNFSIKGNSITVSIRNKDIAAVVRELTTLADLLTRPGTIKDYLVDNFYNEKIIHIRRHNLELLFAGFKEIPNPERICSDALVIDDPVIRFLGFIHSPVKVETDIFKDIWNKARQELKLRICKALAKLEGYCDSLLKFYPAERQPVQLAILDTLGVHGQHRWEEFLLSFLFDAPVDIRSGAINALATCGTLRAIEPLSGIKYPRLRSEARQTIARIQDLHGTQGDGWLSIAGNDETVGGLSLTGNNQPGELGLTEGVLKDDIDDTDEL